MHYYCNNLLLMQIFKYSKYKGVSVPKKNPIVERALEQGSHSGGQIGNIGGGTQSPVRSSGGGTGGSARPRVTFTDRSGKVVSIDPGNKTSEQVVAEHNRSIEVKEIDIKEEQRKVAAAKVKSIERVSVSGEETSYIGPGGKYTFPNAAMSFTGQNKFGGIPSQEQPYILPEPTGDLRNPETPAQRALLMQFIAGQSSGEFRSLAARKAFELRNILQKRETTSAQLGRFTITGTVGPDIVYPMERFGHTSAGEIYMPITSKGTRLYDMPAEERRKFAEQNLNKLIRSTSIYERPRSSRTNDILDIGYDRYDLLGHKEEQGNFFQRIYGVAKAGLQQAEERNPVAYGIGKGIINIPISLVKSAGAILYAPNYGFPEPKINVGQSWFKSENLPMDILNVGTVAGLGIAPKLIRVAAGGVFVGMYGQKVYKERTPENIGELIFVVGTAGAPLLKRPFQFINLKLNPRAVPYEKSGVDVVEGVTIPTELSKLRQLDGQNIDTVHTTLSTKMKFNTILEPQPEQAAGFRKEFGQFNFYQSVPKSGRPQVYGGYVGIGEAYSGGEKIMLSLFPKTAKALIFREQQISGTPENIIRSGIRPTVRFQTETPGTYIPAENLFGASKEGQVASSVGLEGFPIYRLAKGEGPLQGKFTYYPKHEKFPQLLGGEKAPKLLRDVYDFFTRENIRIEFKEARLENIQSVPRNAPKLDITEYSAAYGKTRYMYPSKISKYFKAFSIGSSSRLSSGISIPSSSSWMSSLLSQSMSSSISSGMSSGMSSRISRSSQVSSSMSSAASSLSSLLSSFNSSPSSLSQSMSSSSSSMESSFNYSSLKKGSDYSYDYFDWDFKLGIEKPKRKTRSYKRSFEYQPSLIGVSEKIFSDKVPGFLSGFEVRGMLR